MDKGYAFYNIPVLTILRTKGYEIGLYVFSSANRELVPLCISSEFKLESVQSPNTTVRNLPGFLKACSNVNSSNWMTQPLTSLAKGLLKVLKHLTIEKCVFQEEGRKSELLNTDLVVPVHVSGVAFLTQLEQIMQ